MWMKPHGYLINGNYYDENISTDELDLVLPLYAIETQPPQIKELSDEEIWKAIHSVKHTWVATTTTWYEFEGAELMKLCRAILKKASEK